MSTSIWVIIFSLIVLNLLVVQCRRVKRVVGGTTVPCGAQPRAVSLRNMTSNEHLCGALLLTSEYALTAAHCVLHDPEDYVLQLNNYCVGDNPYPRATVVDIITHDLYDKVTGAHDISILQINLNLDNTTWLDSNILPVSSFGISGECTIYGYGYKDVDVEETSDTLSAANVRLISLDECQEKLGQYIAPQYDSGMICATGENTDACQGDSGGPLICNDKVEGICSYGMSCGVEGIPAVYTSVGSHIQWIRLNTGLSK